MKKTFKITTEEEMINLGYNIGKLSFPGLVITMLGDLGAGKTTMTKGIGKALGITKVINSPTFTIMKVYDGNMKLYHMDVYRINNDSGDDYLEEYFYLDGVCVVEWADNISELLPKNRLDITISIDDDFNRIVTINLNNQDSEYIKLFEGINL